MIWRRPLLAALTLAIAIVAAPPRAAAQENDAANAIERLFTSSPVDPDWFSPGFKSEVPPAQVEQIVEQLTQSFGPFEEVTGSVGAFVLRLQDAEIPVRVALDGDGRIAGLFFDPAVPTTGSIDHHAAAIAALPGETSLVVVSSGMVLASHRPDAPMAVGSAAKLAILKALDESVAAGRLAWDDVVKLEPAWRSLPTGILQDWSAGVPLTLSTLANLMISQSDNTATDALVHVVGRGAVEAITPRNAPFPTTAELFKLKAPGNESLRKAWVEGGRAERENVLDQLSSRPLPAPAELARPTLDVEWFMSASELCDLLRDVAAVPSMHINPGLADPAQWASVAFKGGSETDVLNFSTLLVGEDGAKHCVIATWNNSAELRFESLASPVRGILWTLAKGRP